MELCVFCGEPDCGESNETSSYHIVDKYYMCFECCDRRIGQCIYCNEKIYKFSYVHEECKKHLKNRFEVNEKFTGLEQKIATLEKLLLDIDAKYEDLITIVRECKD